MPGDSRPSMSDLTSDAMLHSAFERLRQRLLAFIENRVGRSLASKLDPEGIIHEAYLRARPRWLALDPKPTKPDAWIYGQVRDRLIEATRAALGPQRDAGREIALPDDSMAPLAERLVDSQTGPGTAMSRAERYTALRLAIARLDPLDREIVALRYFDGLNFAEIGTILGISQNAATKRAIRALGELRDLIPPEQRPQ